MIPKPITQAQRSPSPTFPTICSISSGEVLLISHAPKLTLLHPPFTFTNFPIYMNGITLIQSSWWSWYPSFRADPYLLKVLSTCLECPHIGNPSNPMDNLQASFVPNMWLQYYQLDAPTQGLTWGTNYMRTQGRFRASVLVAELGAEGMF